MKKRVLLLLALALCLVLAGCSQGNDSKGENKENKDAQNTSQEANASGGYVFVKDGVEIKMNARADELIQGLGKPQSEFIAPTCAFQGNDKVFTYPGFQLNTYQNEKSEDFVLGVLLTDDSVATKEGLRLFDPISKVKELYGETEVKEGLYRYEKGDCLLSIVDNNGKVYSIEYRAIIK